eukprot:gnl/MRDRNA2_/MRDRNA2_59491_c0_seq2.p1 gnl/MRDRNA2_/MRDRNA2_59491_c0~~gnl/MRDRNA2_/MRDRNA2_59491_c0_seq2.p1  ORF type:complete len:476 (-),score=110.89 gnl/MRDRNA2_/MRDRNA2_59491_c0_seq2:357-1784(-)
MAEKVSFGPWDPDCRVALVCGGGPAGLLTACVLAKHGYKVHVFEKREDPTKARPGRSWRIVLQQRGVEALKLANLDVASANVGLRVHGAMIHNSRGKRELPYNPDVACMGVDRTDLMKALLGKIRFAGGPNLHFESSFVKLSADTDFVEFSGPLRGPQGPWALLVAADGEHSAVRAELVNHHGFVKPDVTASGKDYIQISVPGKEMEDIGLGSKHVNVFSDMPADAQLILTARAGGTVGGVLVLNDEGANSFKAFRELNDAEFKTAMQKYFTKEGMKIVDIAYDGKFQDYFKNAEVFPGNATTHCSCFDAAGGRVLILGDAAHSMTAALGQGCNTALEDVSVLDALLREGIPCSKLAEEFTKRRHEDVAAVLDMSVNAFPKTKVGFLKFIMTILLVDKIYAVLPRHFPQPSRRLIATDAPFKEVRRRKEFEEKFFTACCCAAFAGLAKVLAPPVVAKGAGIASCFAFLSAAARVK